MKYLTSTLVFLLTLIISSISYANDTAQLATATDESANEIFISLILDKLDSGQYTSASDIVSTSLREAGITPRTLYRCTSFDGTAVCFCPAGSDCWRTPTDCACIDGGGGDGGGGGDIPIPTGD